MKSTLLCAAVIYLCLISLSAVFITLYDKSAARLKNYRIPESALVFISVLGGSAAMLVSMILIRHKTKHIKFMLGIPIIIAFQTVIISWLLQRFF